MTTKTEAQAWAEDLFALHENDMLDDLDIEAVRRLLLKQEAAIKVLRTCVKDAAPLQDDKRLRALFDAALTVTEGL